MIISIFTLILGLTACKEDPEDPVPFEPELSISDLSLDAGDTYSIIYELTPAGTLADVTLDITDSTVPNVISIDGFTVSAIQAGTATVTATAVNKPNAEQTFSVSTTFTVTVTGSTSSAPGSVLNGGFEDALSDWTIVSPYGSDVFSTEVVENNPHGGLAALSLWYDQNEDGEGELVDLSLSQSLSNIEPGTYLFSLWYQGSVDTITMRLLDAITTLEEETFIGYGYDPVPNHLGYVQYGIELTLTETTTITIEIEVDGAVDSWGYIDDIGFNQGTLDDLLVAPQSNEEGYINFITNGDFELLSGWNVDITGPATNKTANVIGGVMQVWADGEATFHIYRNVTLEDAIYTLVIYLNGGVIGEEFNASSAYIYVNDGTNLHTIDIQPEGWNAGLYKRIEQLDISLSGEVEIGIMIEFNGGTNNWINFNDFYLFSESYPIPDPDVLAAEEVDIAILALPAVEDLTVFDEDNIVQARVLYDALTTTQQELVEQLSLLETLETALETLLSQVIEEEGYANFVEDGDFTVGTAWTMTATGTAVSKTVSVLDGVLQLWADGEATFDVYQTVQLDAETYHLVAYINGGEQGVEFNATEAYLYVDDGTNQYTIPFEPVGWNNGDYTRIALYHLPLSGTVEVGLHIVFDGGTNNWINIDDFTLFSEAFEATSDEQAAATVDSLIADLPDVTELTLGEETDVEDARDAYENLTAEQQLLVTKLGDLEALEARIAQLYLDRIQEDGYANFLLDGDFAESDDWDASFVTNATDAGNEVQSGRYVIWANGTGTFDLSQTVTLEEGIYHLTLYINGGVFGTEFNVDEAYAYVTMGDTTHQLDIIPVGWDNGEFKRIELRNISLSGEVEVGIHINFTSGSNNWITLEDFTLWSLDYPIDEADLTAAQAVIDAIDALPSFVDLTASDQTNVEASRTLYNALTSTQTLLVTNYLDLVELEQRLSLILSDPIALFNDEGEFESPDWSMRDIGWSVLGGNLWTDGDTANTGSQAYNVFKDQTSLNAVMEKPVSLDAGTYQLSFYAQGGENITFSITIGSTTQSYTLVDGYQQFTLDFTHTEGDILITINISRTDSSGWVTIDDMLITVQP
jgi:hypothetical protein